MALRGPRLEFSVGAFLVLALASLMVLAVASTNQRFGGGGGEYRLIARFSQIGQLRKQAPVKIGGVVIGQVADIQLDPVKYDSIITLSLEDKFKDLPADTSAGIYTSGLLGESYIGLQPGGDPDVLKSGDEIVFTQPAVDLIQLVGKYMFSGPGNTGAAQSHDGEGGQTPAQEPQP
ncbi:MAG: outer membrane lipid asymmetry maintenance protein MlaD [Stenotrophomonas sp.]